MHRISEPRTKLYSCLWLGIIIVLAIRFPILYGDFFPLDDYQLVFAPQLVSPPSWASLGSIFMPGTGPDYYPIRDISYLGTRYFLGSSAYDFRVHQLVLFGELVFLVFFLLRALRVSPWISLITTLLWASHPVHTEMIGWISSRKDILALIYGCYAILAFIGAIRRKSILLYLLAETAFILSLFSKASLSGLPLVGLLATFVGVKSVNKKQPIIALLIASIAGLGTSLFAGWYYSTVNDMRFFYPLAYRIQASAAAFAKMSLGWFVPELNIVDIENSGNWLDLHTMYIIPGICFWVMLLCLLFVSFRRMWHLPFLTISAVFVLYLPVSGLVFPHRQFYSVRYLEPCLLVVTVGVAIFVANLVRKASTGRVRSLKFGAVSLAVVLSAQAISEAEIWSEPLRVIKKSQQSQPDSISLKILEYYELGNILQRRPQEQPLSRKAALRLELDRLCGSHAAEIELPCVSYWSALFKETGPQNLGLRTMYLNRANSIRRKYPFLQDWGGMLFLVEIAA